MIKTARRRFLYQGTRVPPHNHADSSCRRLGKSCLRFLRHAEQRCGDLRAGDGLSGMDTAVGIAGERADRAERIDVLARPVRNGVAVGEAPLRRGVAQLKETAEHRQRLLTADGRGGEEAEPAVAVVAALRYAEGIHGAHAVLRPVGDAAVVGEGQLNGGGILRGREPAAEQHGKFLTGDGAVGIEVPEIVAGGDAARLQEAHGGVGPVTVRIGEGGGQLRRGDA